MFVFLIFFSRDFSNSGKHSIAYIVSSPPRIQSPMLEGHECPSLNFLLGKQEFCKALTCKENVNFQLIYRLNREWG